MADPKIPWEDGRNVDNTRSVGAKDCMFFTGLTMHNNKWWTYYGGSEYYICLANAAYPSVRKILAK